MIATKGQDARIRYTLRRELPPTEISWALYDQANAAKATGTVTPPTVLAVSTASTTVELGEAVLTVSSQISASQGDLVRIKDDLGTLFDCLLVGSTATSVKVDGFGGDVSLIATVWAPEIQIVIPGAYLDATGKGWRLALSITDADAVIRQDTIWLTVGLFSSDLSVSPREFQDQYPAAVPDITTLTSRRDWPRLVRSAVEMVEAKIAAEKKIHTAVVAGESYKRAVCAALGVILAPESVPRNFSNDQKTYLDRVDAEFLHAVRDVLSSASYDADMDGYPGDDESIAPTDATLLRW